MVSEKKIIEKKIFLKPFLFKEFVKFIHDHEKVVSNLELSYNHYNNLFKQIDKDDNGFLTPSLKLIYLFFSKIISLINIKNTQS